MQAPGIPENEEQRLKSLYITGLLDTRDDERFERLTRLARKAFQVPVALISLLDREPVAPRLPGRRRARNPA